MSTLLCRVLFYLLHHYEMTEPKTRTTLYKDHKNEFRWRTQAANNRIVGAATEGYKNKQECIENAKLNGALQIIEEELKK